MSEQDVTTDKWQTPVKERPHGRSLFWPVALIAVGTIVLLANLGLIPQPDWVHALNYWPLLLIFIGLDILVTRVPAPGGTFLSLILSLLAVGALAFLLFAGSDSTVLRSVTPQSGTTRWVEAPVNVPIGDAEAALIRLDLSNQAATVEALADSGTLVGGSIWTTGDLELDVEVDNDRTEVAIGERSRLGSWMNPSLWFSPEAERDTTWRLAINERVPTDLRISAGNGAATLDLSSLTLTNLELDGSNGRISGTLPAGTYDGRIDGGNGMVQLVLPPGGRQVIEVDGGNGALRLELPVGVPARVEFDEGNGRVSVDGRFDLIEGDADEGVYETSGYSESEDGILLEVDTGNGSLSISQP